MAEKDNDAPTCSDTDSDCEYLWRTDNERSEMWQSMLCDSDYQAVQRLNIGKNEFQVSLIINMLIFISHYYQPKLTKHLQH